MRTLTSNVVSNADALAMRPVLEKHDSFRHSPLLPELRAALAGEGDTHPDADPLGVADVDLTEEARGEGEGEGGAEGNTAPTVRAVSAPALSGAQTKARELPRVGGERQSPADSGASATSRAGAGYGVVWADPRKPFAARQDEDGSALAPDGAPLHTISATNWFDVSVLQMDNLESGTSPAITGASSSHREQDPSLPLQAYHQHYDVQLDEVEAEDIERAILEQARIERKIARKLERERRKAYLSADILFVRSKMRAAYKLVT